MESSSIDPSSSSSGSIQEKKKKRHPFLVIMVIIIVASLILAPFVIPILTNQNHQILKGGDYLEYKVSGFSNNTNFTSSYNITV